MMSRSYWQAALPPLGRQYPQREETLPLSSTSARTLDDPPALPTDHLPTSFEVDHLGLFPAGDVDRANFTISALDMCNMSLYIRPEDLFDPVYQTTFRDLFSGDHSTFVPADTTTTYGASQPAPATQPISASVTHSPPSSAHPSPKTSHTPSSEHTSHGSPSDTATTSSSPPTSSPASPTTPSPPPHCPRSSESDSDADYVPTSRRKQKKGKTTSSKSKKRVSPSPKPTHTRPYRLRVPSRNFQLEDAVVFTENGPGFKCPVAGCEYGQENRRKPELRRHILTHSRWMEPEKWTCCGVGMDRAHLYAKGIKEGMTDEECVEAGAYMFRGQLMIGGCMRTFSRRDALKRHVDNHNLPCVGHMASYPS